MNKPDQVGRLTPPLSSVDFSELVTQLEPYLHAIARRLAGKTHGAEDLVQQTWLKAWRGIHSLRDPSTVRPWLVRILVNEARNVGRREKAVGESLDEAYGIGRDDLYAAERKQFELISQEASPLERVMQQERLERLEGAVSEVEPKYRDALVLKMIEELSVEEIADVLQVSSGAVQKRVQRAKKDLARRIWDLRVDFAA